MTVIKYRISPGTYVAIPQLPGTPGADGGEGPPGADGNTILHGTGNPTSGDGVDGDFWVNTTAHTIYGPKTAGAWGVGTSLIGPEGDPGAPGGDGDDGAPGVGVPAGGVQFAFLMKDSATDYDTTWVTLPYASTSQSGLTFFASDAETIAGTEGGKAVTPESLSAALDALAGSGVADGDKGDIVVSSGGTVWMLDSGVVTAAAKTVLDDASTSAMLTTLGGQPLDSDLTTIAGLTATTDNIIQSVGSAWASRTPAQVRTALGLVVGTDVQAFDSDLSTWAGLTPSANAQALVTAANYAAMRALLDLEAGTDFYSITAADAAFQPKDSDLTAIAGLTATTDNFIVSVASAWSSRTPSQVRTTLALVIGTNVQAWDADLDAIAALSATNDDIIQRKAGAWTNRTMAQLKTDLAITAADVGAQPADADLTTWAGLTPSANAQSLVTAANYAAMRALLDLEAGTDFYSITAADAAFQPKDSDLTTIAGLTATTDNFIVSVSSAWASRTPAQVKTTLSLNNVDNTSDASKPVSTATQTALDAKGPIRKPITTSTATTYAPTAADENTLVTLNNASGVTVTMPSNATQAIPVGAEIDFVWWGGTQVTFAAGGSATLVGTPGLKLRAQYSSCTVKKMATNDWLIVGDLSA
jgi:hypothetical protein